MPLEHEHQDATAKQNEHCYNLETLDSASFRNRIVTFVRQIATRGPGLACTLPAIAAVLAADAVHSLA
ncbi:hypothetical protein [Enhygromyxa salina]|uniref:hypothetical protein n=1 Tax=Enhygromyxa salina TaxID=215803 RepID=UPI0011B27C87|nr:hypothetical protein [Enhygromyxa salina]